MISKNKKRDSLHHSSKPWSALWGQVTVLFLLVGTIPYVEYSENENKYLKPVFDVTRSLYSTQKRKNECYARNKQWNTSRSTRKSREIRSKKKNGERNRERRKKAIQLSIEGSNKDARQDGDDGPSWSTIVNGKKTTPTPTPTPVSNTFHLLSQPNSYPDESMRGGSISSRGSARGAPRGAPRGGSFRSLSQQRFQQPPPQDRPSDLGENTRFFTPVQNGPLRDEIVVECRTLNDRPFRGSITFKEVTEFMFTEVMGFQFADLYSVRMRFSGCPTVRFKLKDQTNIDDLRSVNTSTWKGKHKIRTKSTTSPVKS